MRYYLRDKVKIKDGIDVVGSIDDTPQMRETIKNFNTNKNRLVTICFISHAYHRDFPQPRDFFVEELTCKFNEDMIECLAEDYKKPVPINNRWELLDL